MPIPTVEDLRQAKDAGALYPGVPLYARMDLAGIAHRAWYGNWSPDPQAAALGISGFTSLDPLAYRFVVLPGEEGDTGHDLVRAVPK
ncbi:hypothetical protein BJN34_09460 [Cupriavidus necator]|uniref:Uncharacterized protein n=1 Tax=Cupriavidus necator TaxID=106590 RepID=A0A1U9UPM7_CUPNE|nr:hypothetical protein [Cupriavidus necator]AQV94115.1 hypothetical protein BJN34_09460 [Cupriavidus necator]